tara:strand:+ start:23598 stop:24752 length:1155 start_codon:yes stop_codon:yes gene_type:complete
MQKADTLEAHIGLGSNQGNRFIHLQRALFKINEEIGTVVVLSKCYKNKAVGFDGDDFINACIAVRTRLDAHEVLKKLLVIENELGRKRKGHFSYTNRPIDLDLLYYEDQTIQTEQLELPHPRLAQRRFVLQPLMDIAPEKKHPLNKRITAELLAQCEDENDVIVVEKTLYMNHKSFWQNSGYICIEGCIGVGKTSLCQKIAEAFEVPYFLESFEDNPFLSSFYKDKVKYSLPVELSFLADRSEQIEDHFQNINEPQGILSDYHLSKSLMFAEINLKGSALDLYKRWYNFSLTHLKNPSLYVYLQRPLETIKEQILKRGRPYEMGISENYLKKIIKSYEHHIKVEKDFRCLQINLEKNDFMVDNEAFKKITIKIEDALLNHHYLD